MQVTRTATGRALAAAFLAAASSIAAPAAGQTADHRWGGLVHDAFTFDGLEVWTVEDGGRIRHRDSAGNWTFQTTPDVVLDTLRRIQFVTPQIGWAVGNSGWVICTTDGGANWSAMSFVPAVIGTGPEDLWDIHFIDAQEGWLTGLHGIWHSIDGGANWTAATLLDKNGAPITAPALAAMELYAIDVVDDGAGQMLGLASAEPGWIFRATTPLVWQVVFDVEDACPAPGTPCTQAFSATQLAGCGCDRICGAGLAFEPWDIEISRHPTEKLALCVGGLGPDCGLILASDDDGLTWRFERHECTPLSNCSGPSHNPPQPGQTHDVWHLKRFQEIYGLAIFHGDNSAIAGGYKGQHLRRVPASGGQPAHWKDETTYSDDINVPASSGAITSPIFGGATDGGTAQNGRGVLTGTGGYIRRTTDGGDTWTTDQPGEPWRIRDVHFVDGLKGWMVSQFYRIARTTDGGASWTPDIPLPSFAQPFLNAIVIDASGNRGVTVGDYDVNTGRPKIYFNLSLSTPGVFWAEPSTLVDVLPPVPSVPIYLHEVEWAGGLVFWAVGGQGLIYRSDATLGPDRCDQYVPSGSGYDEFSTRDFHGVSFGNPNDGVFVGLQRILGVPTGRAYHYHHNGTTDVWTEIPIAEAGVEVLTDVAFDGSVAYAVGLQDHNGRGVVLRSTFSGGAFAPFTLVHGVAPCTVGDDAGSFPVLEEVEIDPGGNVWVGGECGRVWRSANGSAWSPIRIQTDSNVRGMSFPGADQGFLACHRGSRTGHAIVRVTP